MANPSKTLQKILSIIDKDVTKIKKSAASAQLSKDDALTLSRYAGTLADITGVKAKEKESVKKDLEKLSTDELIKAYEKEKKGKKNAIP